MQNFIKGFGYNECKLVITSYDANINDNQKESLRDLLHILVGPLTQVRAKWIKEVANGLIRVLWNKERARLISNPLEIQGGVVGYENVVQIHSKELEKWEQVEYIVLQYHNFGVFVAMSGKNSPRPSAWHFSLRGTSFVVLVVQL